MKFKMVIITAFIIALLAFNASAGCGRWVVRDNTDYLQDPVFDALASGQDTASGPDAASGQDAKAPGASSQEAAQTKSEDKGASANNTPADAIALDVSGKWLVKFGDNSTPLNLILIQSGSRVQGYGSLLENGKEIPATAIGSVSGDAVSLEVKLVSNGANNKSDKKQKLELTASNGVLKGAYETYLADKLEGKGGAVAAKS